MPNFQTSKLPSFKNFSTYRLFDFSTFQVVGCRFLHLFSVLYFRCVCADEIIQNALPFALTHPTAVHPSPLTAHLPIFLTFSATITVLTGIFKRFVFISDFLSRSMIEYFPTFVSITSATGEFFIL
mgnify:CR=1 FL=1